MNMSYSYSKVNNICLIILAAFITAVTLHLTASAMIPFVFSIFLYATLRPVVQWFQSQARVPKSLAMGLTFLILLGAFSLMGVLVYSSVEHFLHDGVTRYEDSIQNTISYVVDQLDRVGFRLNRESILKQSANLPLVQQARALTGQIFYFLGNFIMVLIFTLFMLSGEEVSQGAKSPLVREIMTKVSTYISAKIFLSLITGLCVWIVLLLFNVEMAFVFALLTILLNFIPTVGSLVATLLPLPVLFLQYQLSVPFWAVLLSCFGVQFFIGNILETKMLGDSMDLHPITVLLCLIFWGLIWGVAGMFLAVPITAILKIVLSRLPSTHTFSEVLAGRFH